MLYVGSIQGAPDCLVGMPMGVGGIPIMPMDCMPIMTMIHLPWYSRPWYLRFPSPSRRALALQGDASARPRETELDAGARFLCVPMPLSACAEYVCLSLARPIRLTLGPSPRSLAMTTPPQSG